MGQTSMFMRAHLSPMQELYLPRPVKSGMQSKDHWIKSSVSEVLHFSPAFPDV